LEGPVARDVLENFVQRWKKQAPSELHDLLFDTSPKNGFISIEQEQGNYKDPNELWNVQLFRSIDHHSATISGIDASIQECYINAIRHAERFIYVENQYFLGSCQHWEKDKDVGCTNVIPFEIVNKICSKIRNKEQFNVYVVIPMYPEGIPEDGAVQEVLFWQYRTQAFMNLTVYRTIEEVYASSPNKPQVTDYLNFYCLGARETAAGSEAQVHDPKMLPNATEMDKAIHAARRFCVYVHSKMMIVDDAYVVVGSANINERSMSGYRDTEIAMGAFQPAYYSGPGVGGAGKVHQFRLSLWAEHTGISHPIFSRPNTVDCAQLMNRLADENWEAFIGKEVVDLKGHLLRYPIRVDPATGKTISTVEFIPETKGKFRGTKSFILADKLTS
jgi:phospholipase D1/2